jgi:imidazolonepropionase-like amidohydrolase
MKHASIFLTLILFACTNEDRSSQQPSNVIIHELNEKEIVNGTTVIALVGGMLIDGNGSEPLQNSLVIVRNEKIEFVGKAGDMEIPIEAEVIDAKGLTLLPGLIDAHYHNEESLEMAPLFLSKGVTSVRDPGAWIEAYDSVRAAGKSLPRLFLTGPHINKYPPAYPRDSYIVQDAVEGQQAVEKLVSQGATAIKVYYGLSIGIIKQVCESAHLHGLPVTAHLEITNARDAIEAGLDGIEHVTSFGTCLLPLRDAEKYKQKVMGDNDARKRGRYEVWNSLNLDNNINADTLIQVLSKRKTFVSPTLAAFEKQSDKGDSVEVNGFKNMLKFVGMARKEGVRMVVGSHSWVPYAEPGFAYFREMELLRDAGLSNMEVLQAATMENARFFRIDERLGSIEKGKIADIILVEGNPLDDIKVMRNVKKVMLGGVWISGSN